MDSEVVLDWTYVFQPKNMQTYPQYFCKDSQAKNTVRCQVELRMKPGASHLISVRRNLLETQVSF